MILILVAFLGGLISLFSPCSGAVLPVYFSVTFKTKGRLIAATVIYSLGILSIALPVGLGITFLFKYLAQYGDILFKGIGLAFLLLAFYTIYISLNPKSSMKESKDSEGFIGIYMMGLSAGISLGVCTGPILGAVLTFAASTQSVLNTILLIFTYILGMVSPLFIISAGISKLTFFKKIFVEGKLIKFHLKNKEYYLHTTNLLLIIFYFLISYIFLFRSGSLGILEGSYVNFLHELQDKLIILTL